MPRSAGTALLLLLTAALAACSTPEHVPVPPADADPTEVVQAYVAAINARDRDTLAALSEDGGIPETWLDTRIDLVEIDEPYEDSGAGTRHDGEDVIGVPVQIIVDGTDGSMPDGEQTGWGYLLVQQDGRWVVFSQGVG
ncbi:MAG: hypothetical protein HGA44_21555 [Cellulomonadaceae bacterium]|nr:hypothetical protein [Cellulomonadaceae bacterium]